MMYNIQTVVNQRDYRNYIRSALDDGRNLISHPFSLEKSISRDN
jgi:hypothetical protein